MLTIHHQPRCLGQMILASLAIIVGLMTNVFAFEAPDIPARQTVDFERHIAPLFGRLGYIFSGWKRPPAMVSAMGNHTTLTIAGASGGNFQLNIMMPLMASTILESIDLLSNGTEAFGEFWYDWTQANDVQCEAVGRAKLGDVYQLEPADRLRTGCEVGERGDGVWKDDPRNLPRAGYFARRYVDRSARSLEDDRTSGVSYSYHSLSAHRVAV